MHEFIEALQDICPDYQRRFATLRAASEALSLQREYREWLLTPGGKAITLSAQNVVDVRADTARMARMRDAALRIAQEHGIGMPDYVPFDERPDLDAWDDSSEDSDALSVHPMDDSGARTNDE